MIDLLRKAARAGAAAAFDRLAQVSRLPAERRAAGAASFASQLWRSLDRRNLRLRAISACARARPGRAEELLLAQARKRAPLLPALADLAATVRVTRAQFPGAVAATMAAADQALAHRFTLFGWMEAQAEAEINWLREPTRGVVCPLDFWADLDFESGTLGEVRVLWELNRHQHLLDLARAYCFSGDPRYVREIEAQVRSWTAQNPFGLGVNWASSLEVALRAISWLWARALLLAAGGLSPGLNAEITAAGQLAGRHVARHLSRTYSPNTHLLGEALGLLYIGALLPELGQARRWFALGRRILIGEAQRQFLRDGFHFEHSTWYHRFATDMYLHAALLCERAGRPLPQGTLLIIGRMLECLAVLGARAGQPYLVGDDDGGRVLPLAHLSPYDFRDTLALGAALLGRADLKPAGREPAEAVLWLYGPQGLRAYDAMPPGPEAAESVCLAAAGMSLMQSPQHASLLFDYGNHARPLAAHGHAGALAIQLRTTAGPVLTDPGTAVYLDAPWRAYFRSSAAHNTITVDRASQSHGARPFEWQTTGRIIARTCNLGPGFDYAEATYAWPGPTRGIVHTRKILYVKPQYWVVVDLVRGRGEHFLEQWFHFPPGAVRVNQDGACCAEMPGAVLWLMPMAGTCDAALFEGQVDPPQGWFSDYFGRRVAAPALRYSKRAQLPAAFVTLIALQQGSARPLELTQLAEPDGFPLAVGLAVAHGSWRDEILLAPHDRRIRPCGACQSDAAVARVRWDAAQDITELSLCAGSFISRDGTDLVRLAAVARRLHILRQAGRAALQGDVSGEVWLGWATQEVLVNGRAARVRQAGDGTAVVA